MCCLLNISISKRMLQACTFLPFLMGSGKTIRCIFCCGTLVPGIKDRLDEGETNN
jgi:hypothetical protein